MSVIKSMVRKFQDHPELQPKRDRGSSYGGVAVKVDAEKALMEYKSACSNVPPSECTTYPTCTACPAFYAQESQQEEGQEADLDKTNRLDLYNTLSNTSLD